MNSFPLILRHAGRDIRHSTSVRYIKALWAFQSQLNLKPCRTRFRRFSDEHLNQTMRGSFLRVFARSRTESSTNLELSPDLLQSSNTRLRPVSLFKQLIFYGDSPTLQRRQGLASPTKSALELLLRSDQRQFDDQRLLYKRIHSR